MGTVEMIAVVVVLLAVVARGIMSDYHEHREIMDGKRTLFMETSDEINVDKED